MLRAEITPRRQFRSRRGCCWCGKNENEPPPPITKRQIEEKEKKTTNLACTNYSPIFVWISVLGFFALASSCWGTARWTRRSFFFLQTSFLFSFSRERKKKPQLQQVSINKKSESIWTTLKAYLRNLQTICADRVRRLGSAQVSSSFFVGLCLVWVCVCLFGGLCHIVFKYAPADKSHFRLMICAIALLFYVGVLC